MELISGKLYETKRGQRFRVTMDGDCNFVCEASYSGWWDSKGRAHGKSFFNGKYKRPHLVKEVVEDRMISVSACDRHKYNNIAYEHGHYFARVSREIAREQAKKDQVKSGEVRIDANNSFTWAFRKNNLLININDGAAGRIIHC